MRELPVVVVPVGADDAALDTCLGALESATPAGTRVWLADDAQAGPRAQVVIDHWLARTRMTASHTRRPRALGESAHLDDVLRACGVLDVAVLAGDAQPLPGWLERLTDCLALDGSIASATPWSNAGETAAWPRVGEVGVMPDDRERLARAAAQMPGTSPELPAAVSHCVLLRGVARARAGGLDAATFGSWSVALVDLSLRMAGLGWRNVLCDTAFVARPDEAQPADHDLPRLSVRWPAWNARLAPMLMRDPLRDLRDQLGDVLATIGPLPPQGDLFAERSLTTPSS